MRSGRVAPGVPSSELDADETYAVVRRAVRDAIWDVLGTLAMAAFAVVLLFVGVSVASAGLRATGPLRWLTLAFGVVVAVAAFVQLLREFRIGPFSR